MHTLKIGLTGGIASGKSTAQAFFESLGIKTIDHDLLARQVVQKDQPGLSQLVQAFGSSILTPDHTLDREALKALIFSNPSAKQTVEAIIHPLVFELSNQIFSRYTEEPYILIVSPLLIESGSAASMDKLIVVSLDQGQQLQRLLKRDGMTEELAKSIIKSQATPAQRQQAAHYLLENNNDLNHLKEQVHHCHNQLIQLSQTSSNISKSNISKSNSNKSKTSND